MVSMFGWPGLNTWDVEKSSAAGQQFSQHVRIRPSKHRTNNRYFFNTKHRIQLGRQLAEESSIQYIIDHNVQSYKQYKIHKIYIQFKFMTVIKTLKIHESVLINKAKRLLDTIYCR